jgi:hypothetical protein
MHLWCHGKDGPIRTYGFIPHNNIWHQHDREWRLFWQLHYGEDGLAR